jgi:hypothetical protein
MPELLFAGMASPIPILSLWQPWATLIAAGYKWHETRHWPTRLRGRIAIHATQRLERDLDDDLADLARLALADLELEAHPRGEVVAIADLTGCFRTEDLVAGRPPLLGDAYRAFLEAKVQLARSDGFDVPPEACTRG